MDDAFHAPAYIEFRKVSDELPLAMLYEMANMMISNLKQIEMEHIEESTPDIDSCDAGDSLALLDYVDDIYSFYRENEDLSCRFPDYMPAQADIDQKVRAFLIDLLIEMCYRLQLLDETLFLTVNIVHRYLPHENVLRKKLQFIGFTTMLFASKYEDASVPTMKNIILIYDRTYARQIFCKASYVLYIRHV